MTDRIHAFIVTLAEDTRSDDAVDVATALRMVKGVADVHPLVADPQAYAARARVRAEMVRRLYDALNADREQAR